MTDASLPAEPSSAAESAPGGGPADAGRSEASVPSRPSRPATPLWLAVVLAALAGAFYAYDVWEAVGNLVGLNITAGSLGVSLTAYGVTLLVVGVVLPFAVFALAFWLGRRRGPAAQLLLFVAGYALVQVLAADVTVLFGLGGLDLG